MLRLFTLLLLSPSPVLIYSLISVTTSSSQKTWLYLTLWMTLLSSCLLLHSIHSSLYNKFINQSHYLTLLIAYRSLKLFQLHVTKQELFGSWGCLDKMLIQPLIKNTILKKKYIYINISGDIVFVVWTEFGLNIFLFIFVLSYLNAWQKKKKNQL